MQTESFLNGVRSIIDYCSCDACMWSESVARRKLGEFSAGRGDGPEDFSLNAYSGTACGHVIRPDSSLLFVPHVACRPRLPRSSLGAFPSSFVWVVYTVSQPSNSLQNLLKMYIDILFLSLLLLLLLLLQTFSRRIVSPFRRSHRIAFTSIYFV